MILKLKPILLLSFTLILFHGNAQDENVVGNNFTIQSEVYGADRTIQIYTPEEYSTSEKEYPVLYLLDGQRWFLQAVSYQRLFAEYQYTPEFIVVGIHTDDSPRFGFFADAEKLTDFIQKEVFPFVDSHLRASQERLLFGWQFAGSFALSTLDKNSNAFDGYLAASPIPIDLSAINLSAWDSFPDKTIFIATAENERQVNDGVNRLVDSLKQTALRSLEWERKMVSTETISSFGHRTTPLAALYHGLRFFYDDYPLLEFDKLEDFNLVGGVDYVYKYYRERGKKYDLPGEIPHEGMFFLARLGMDVDHFSVFSQFMGDFIDRGFLENVNLGWGTRYAEFYLKNDDTEGAKRVYNILVRRFNENARPVNGLGDVLSKVGDLKMAEDYYKKAIALAVKNGDRRLESYQKDLQELTARKEND